MATSLLTWYTWPLPPTDDTLVPAPETLPTMYDLPSGDPEEPGLPDEFHYYQPQLLRETFVPPGRDPARVFTASDLNLYYAVRQPLWYKRPGWFAVLDVPHWYEDRDLRMSYVMWQERVAPYLVVELLSPGTEDEDQGKITRDTEHPPTKWTVYEQILQVPYYVLFSRYTDDAQFFVLTAGQYTQVSPSDQRLWLPDAGLGIGVWEGTYQGLTRQWLRFYDAVGLWLSTPLEREQQHMTQERQRAEQEHQRAERLAAQLRALGIDPTQ